MNNNGLKPYTITVPVFFLLFFGGGFVGIKIAHFVAPGSGIAEFINFFTLPVAFMTGMIFWAGMSLPTAIRRLIRISSGRTLPDKKSEEISPVTVPPGSFAFVPPSVIISIFTGILMAAFSEAGLYNSVGLNTPTGFIYGVVCWRLARLGYLQFPNE